ncbi:neurohypophysial n-terminal domain containing protein [Stylonychia lemnae]|uniref:Neurohypophysial n-terminal domain containing protein n=1 Tax=Stylonychia lemnae TaxID=5949 RepID=A0A078AQF7_STYLE|nr:neurohypophysial n-terminal domain containing protein [Stylonychia lemnae]|eukprot:CDW84379.1 neurohypophysial n-terminal domain containing protein [Stylonychia lemnae]
MRNLILINLFFLFFVTFVKPQIVTPNRTDSSFLCLIGKGEGPLGIYSNPLQNADQTKTGFYSFWFYLEEQRINRNTHQIVDFNFTESKLELQMFKDKVNCFVRFTKDGGTLKENDCILAKWFNVIFGFNKTSSVWFYRYDTQAGTYIDVGTKYSHKEIFTMINYLDYDNGDDVCFGIGEISFWSIDQTKFSVDDFHQKFYSISYRGYSETKSEYLVDLYQPRAAKSNNTYNFAYYNRSMKADFFVKYRVKWRDVFKTTKFYCFPGFRYDAATNSCVACTSPCKECSYISSTICLSCKTGFLFVNYQCVVNDCSKGQYFDLAAGNCKTCNAPCSSCQGSNKCTYCLPTHNYLDDGSNTCLAVESGCPDGSFLDPEGFNVCRKCSEGCTQCASLTSCMSCLSGYNLYDGECQYIDCPYGSYYSSSSLSCIGCSDGCENCDSTTCFQCSAGMYLSAGECIEECPKGFYGNNESNSCMKCQDNCLSCQTNQYTCTSCADKYFLKDSACVDRCPILGYFVDLENKKCASCVQGCDMCLDGETQCSLCQKGKYLTAARTCVDECEINTFPSDTGYCYPCDSACKNCFGSSSTACTACSPGYYLTGTSCVTSCPNPFFSDDSSNKCEVCSYFCEQCTTKKTCDFCAYGYIQTKDPNNCLGEYFLRTNQTKKLTLEFNRNALPENSDLGELTMEIWFKSKNIESSYTEVIVGLSPYKIKKKPGWTEIYLHYQGMLSYCETTQTPLQSNVWYHFAFTLNEITLKLYCYLDGQPVSIGTNPGSLIAKKISNPSEMVIGGTNDNLGFENNFDGWTREFRLWNVSRTPFEINNFKNIDVSQQKSKLVAYWKLNEKNDGSITTFTDYSYLGNPSYDPAPMNSIKKLIDYMDFREVFLMICPESYYVKFYERYGIYQCLKCNPLCLNCIGPTSNDCIQCQSPLKLLEELYTCAIISKCPEGYYQDYKSGQCLPCNPYCKHCEIGPNNCQACKVGFFQQYLGKSCVDQCPDGMYGNYEKQQCYFYPIIKYVNPVDGSAFQYGSFIELTSDFLMLNKEPNNTYYYGWRVIRETGSLDITNDAIKTYYQTNLTKVHIDNNIIKANNIYQVIFYVKGNDTYYKDMYIEVNNGLYIGTPPRNGKCVITPLIGIATVTKFQMKQSSWVDFEQLIRYDFSYSMDGGQVYIPLSSTNPQLPNLNYTFPPIYDKYFEVKIKCVVTNIRGFSNQALSTITLEKRSTADVNGDLEKLNPLQITDEVQYIQVMNQIKLITRFLGSLPQIQPNQFDPKIDPLYCTSQQCNFKGDCIFQTFTKKYYCNCTEPYAGTNCTYNNQTQLGLIKDISEKLSIGYSKLQNKAYELEFLKLTTSYIEQLSDISFGVIVSIMKFKMLNWEGNQQSDEELMNYMTIISNLIEYTQTDLLKTNITKSWGNDSTKAQNIFDNTQQALELFDFVRHLSLNRISSLQPINNFKTRMIAYRQQLINQESLISIDASNLTKKSEKIMLKISPNNFNEVNLPLEDDFIVEVIEYSFNPFEVNNTQNIAGNIFQASFFNNSDKAKAQISGLKTGLEFFFPFQDNQNVSDFMSEYNSLSPYKAKQQYKRLKMLKNSNLTCVYWSGNKWTSDGCELSGIDLTHIRCQCSHLTAFAPRFQTPKDESIGGPALPDQYQSSLEEKNDKITKEDLMVPLDIYFKNLEELLQHKQPVPIEFIFKPGPYVVIIFWAMYITSLLYYAGRDKQRRYKMTKAQNREDLAEIKDQDVQLLDEVIKEIIVKDVFLKTQQQLDHTAEDRRLLNESSFDITLRDKMSGIQQKFNLEMIDQDQQHEDLFNESSNNNQQLRIPLEFVEQSLQLQQQQQSKLYKNFEDFTKDEQKDIKKRARKKIFGRSGSTCERAKKFYKRSKKQVSEEEGSEQKMKFFNEALKNSLWLGLLSRTSKIAPRHTRLTLMYLYYALYLLLTTFGYIFGYYEKLVEIIQEQMISLVAGVIITCIFPLIICVPVALIFRVPMSYRRTLEGVKTKKINQAFKEIDKQMGTRYAIGYFISFSVYLLMTVVVIFFNYFYPQDYCMSWLFQMVILFFVDIFGFTFGFAAFQLFTSLLAGKLKCFYYFWAFFEVIRYYKNLRG